MWRVTTTTMLTWQAPDGHGFEGVRAHFGNGSALRALGRIVYAGELEWTASYRLVVRDDGAIERVSITSATAERERHLTMNRTEDGFWLLDTGSGGTRTDFGGAVDVDLATSALFNAIPIRRLGLHQDTGEHALPIVFVALPDLEPRVVTQTYRTVAAGDPATVGFSWDDFSADITVDADGMVLDYPGIATRHAPHPAQA